jgi:hypothetical protein
VLTRQTWLGCLVALATPNVFLGIMGANRGLWRCVSGLDFLPQHHPDHGYTIARVDGSKRQRGEGINIARPCPHRVMGLGSRAGVSRPALVGETWHQAQQTLVSYKHASARSSITCLVGLVDCCRGNYVLAWREKGASGVDVVATSGFSGRQVGTRCRNMMVLVRQAAPARTAGR